MRCSPSDCAPRREPITAASRYFAGDQIKQATAFLGWLAHRQHSLRTCDQADIDTWYADHRERDRLRLRGFLLWSMASNLAPPLRLPAPVIVRNVPLAHPERMALLGQLLNTHDLPLRPRVAGVIVLLYAQPLSRIVRLTIDDVLRDGDQVLLRLGQPPSPVPTPFARLLLTWIDERDNMNTATNPNSRWLLPGRRAGQPMHLGVSPAWSTSSAFRPERAAQPPFASTFWKCQAPLSPTRSATTPSPQPRSPPRLASPGVVTPRESTPKLATVEYASSPVGQAH